ncbi:hypothetical protein [Blastococcus sp. TBT05-19]|uniref:hypothetical protein n=1 Tax=Blastococcus sp. TBT05-19 TaxID=2250581 RepID=UPI000DE9A3CB|nr:hypothetical protein [Blastococcus sp. TBT05-19]
MTGLRRAVAVVAAAACALVVAVATDDGPRPVELVESADTANFRAGNIISDQLFYDGNAMSAGDVQAFLEQRNPRCVPAADGTPCLQDARQDTYTRPADSLCPGTYVGAPNEPAATIIAKVGAACGISQRVLLVILQKEQSLVTSSGSSLKPVKYEKAMGYGCPDTAPCDPRYAHLFNQLYSAASRYQYYSRNPDQFNHRAGRVNTVRYHPNAGCGSSQVFIENRATAGLYNYTPYQPNGAALAAGKGTGDGCSAYGNRNFWIFFTDWFGSTQVPGAAEVTGRYATTGGDSGPLGVARGDVACGLRDGGCFQNYANGAIYWSPASGARIVGSGAVRDRWASLTWEVGSLGYPVSDTTCGLRDGGCFQHFQGGSVYWTQGTGARALSGLIRDRWAAQGWESGPLGYPTTDGTAISGGMFAHFQGGSVYWSPGTGARMLSGVVRDRWAAQGWESGPLGYPTTDGTAISGGMFAHFQGGSVYWSQATGARALSAPVRDRWGAHGWENGSLGFPAADAVATPGGKGQAVRFERGWIYWSQAAGAWRVDGPVRDAWMTAGADGGALGMPVADARLTADGVARIGDFQGGSVSVHPVAGTHVLPAPVVVAWRAEGGETGSLGYPTSGAVPTADGRAVVVTFERGEVHATATAGYALSGAVLDRYRAAGGVSGELGRATTGVTALAGGGRFAHFQGGSIYWTQATGARVLSGAVRERWGTTGWENGPLGFPTSDVAALPGGGQFARFQGGSVHWTQAAGTKVLTGAVHDRYEATGGASGELGLPTTDAVPLAGGGRYAHFQGGSVYWTQATGARVLSGAIRDRWAAQGWENGPLGFPTSDVTTLAGGGEVARFQGGSIYWTQATGAHVVSGAVRDRWTTAGSETGPLGYPTTDVIALAGGGRFAHFQGGSIYWTQATGARVLSGAVLDRWAATGWENGTLGYPTTDVTALADGGRYAHFQRGSIYWTQTTGARYLPVAIRDAWAGTGWENGRLGYPTTDPETVPGGTRQTFQNGTITLVDGRTTVQYR